MVAHSASDIECADSALSHKHCFSLVKLVGKNIPAGQRDIFVVYMSFKMCLLCVIFIIDANRSGVCLKS